MLPGSFGICAFQRKGVRVIGKLIRLAILGLSEGNGHPYSWSAICNGYNPQALEPCPFPVISSYLAGNPDGASGIPQMKVTHVWTPLKSDAGSIARFATIPNILDNPADALGNVDAVIVATDDWTEHLDLSRPFLNAGIPVLIDKPLALSIEDLQTFSNYHESGARLMSSSGLRFSQKIHPLRDGPWWSIAACINSSWEKYGIHIIDPLLQIFGPGFSEVRLIPTMSGELFVANHNNGCTVSVHSIQNKSAGFGHLCAFGYPKVQLVQMDDYFHCFRTLLTNFRDLCLGAETQVSFDQTLEAMRVILAGMRSREIGGGPISVVDLIKKVEPDRSLL